GVDGPVRLWGVATARERAALHGDTFGVLAVAFAPGGKTLAVGTFGGAVKLWDVATRREVALLGLPPRGRVCLGFCPARTDGRLGGRGPGRTPVGCRSPGGLPPHRDGQQSAETGGAVPDRARLSAIIQGARTLFRRTALQSRPVGRTALESRPTTHGL